jgi:hypothetical protein
VHLISFMSLTVGHSGQPFSGLLATDAREQCEIMQGLLIFAWRQGHEHI